MSAYRFYQIKSRKSEEYQDGLRQVSLICETSPQIYCFIWINKAEEPVNIQFVFYENIIEWVEGHGISHGCTNRKNPENPLKTGIHKGSRTIHYFQHDPIIEEGVNILQNAEFPADYKATIQDKILATKEAS